LRRIDRNSNFVAAVVEIKKKSRTCPKQNVEENVVDVEEHSVEQSPGGFEDN